MSEPTIEQELGTVDGVADAPAPAARATDRFWVKLGAAVVLGAVIRLVYLSTDDRQLIGGDGFDYHASALRLADGLGYTAVLGDVGAPVAHHPPGWVTLLGAVSWLGGRSAFAHQLTGAIIGLGVVVLAGLIGRRYFNARVGFVAALIAAVYPGFWVLEGNILSEPLGLLVVGILMLLVFDLKDRPTLGRSLAVGVTCGLLALVRSEQLALLLIVVVPVLVMARSLTPRQRAGRVAVAVVACGAMLLPWTIYNAGRFKAPVLLSTNGGSLLLIGNCPGSTYSGELLGWFDPQCNMRLAAEHPGLDRAQRDPVARRAALDNMVDNVDRLPVAVPARFGRLTAIFRPSQTVDLVATWMTTDTKPIWAWIVSFWLLMPLAIIGGVSARRSRRFILPLVGPVIVVALAVAISYGEPRYHTPADLGIVVLAAAGIERLLTWRSRPPKIEVEPLDVQPTKRRSRLSAVHAPQ